MELTESKLEWPCPHCGGDLTKFVDDVTSDAIRYGHARVQELEASLRRFDEAVAYLGRVDAASYRHSPDGEQTKALRMSEAWANVNEAQSAARRALAGRQTEPREGEQ